MLHWNFSQFGRHSWSGTTLGLAALLGLLALIVVPIPRPLVDVGLVLSLGLGLLILGAALRARHPLELTTFPALVLVATLLRIGLNVATTRWILSTGDAGSVVQAFGQFAAGGDFFVGIAVWIVVTILLVVVVAKGSERVAEVAARFSLDGMPGRQMAVDADMRAGVVSFDEARRRRADLQREARLYGAMDGALKFVKGDTMASIAITCANLIVGMALGVSRDGLSAMEALYHYGVVSIGDGLCSQVPSLLTAVAAGIMVTRVPGESDDRHSLLDTLRTELVDRGGRWLEVGAGLVVLGLLPGMPFLPFLGAAVGCLGVYWLKNPIFQRVSDHENLNMDDSMLVRETLGKTGPRLLTVSDETEVVLELGRSLSDILTIDGGSALAAELTLAALLLGERRGVRDVQVGVSLNVSSLRSNEGRILVVGEEYGRFRLDVHCRWFLGKLPDGVGEASVEDESEHPLSGLAMYGISSELVAGDALENEMSLARRVAVAVVGAMWVGAPRLVRLARVHGWLQALETRHPGVVDAVIPSRLSVAGLTRVLKELVASRYPIRDLADILDALSRGSEGALDVDAAVVHAREASAGRLLAGCLRRGILMVWVFPPELVGRLDRQLMSGEFFPRPWLDALAQVEVPRVGHVVLLVPRDGRRLVEELVRMANLRAFVVAMEEVPVHYETVVVGRVALVEAPALASDREG